MLKPICPYCGTKMGLICIPAGTGFLDEHPYHLYKAYFCCGACYSHSPEVIREDHQEAVDIACSRALEGVRLGGGVHG